MRATKTDNKVFYWLKLAIDILQKRQLNNNIWFLQENIIQTNKSWSNVKQITPYRLDRLEQLGWIKRKPSGGFGPMIMIDPSCAL